ncbi:Hpt domain-containing protein [Sphingobacterium bovistauri]|uniref:Hpt domain-containing protein n=1 Tax=Sphingobacterium bovistauri TaxID=2781959 RepID=A0ABS7Z2S5_9SPHI|nr:Hpt domain-containing protein [Sphingobacterium bovistauri]MCA5004476.1 Hpt domain-containing protein [Sphingobacterium bovistauri]
MVFQIIDLDAINQSMMGNDELIKQLIGMYIVQSPLDFQSLDDAILSGDNNLIREKAHHIKPTMQYIGAQNLMDDFQSLESLAKGNAPNAEIISTFEKIKPKFQTMLDELKHLAEREF